MKHRPAPPPTPPPPAKGPRSTSPADSQAVGLRQPRQRSQRIQDNTASQKDLAHLGILHQECSKHAAVATRARRDALAASSSAFPEKGSPMQAYALRKWNLMINRLQALLVTDMMTWERFQEFKEAADRACYVPFLEAFPTEGGKFWRCAGPLRLPFSAPCPNDIRLPPFGWDGSSKLDGSIMELDHIVPVIEIAEQWADERFAESTALSAPWDTGVRDPQALLRSLCGPCAVGGTVLRCKACHERKSSGDSIARSSETLGKLGRMRQQAIERREEAGHSLEY